MNSTVPRSLTERTEDYSSYVSKCVPAPVQTAQEPNKNKDDFWGHFLH